jgi:hypothetical protein
VGDKHEVLVPCLDDLGVGDAIIREARTIFRLEAQAILRNRGVDDMPLIQIRRRR